MEAAADSEVKALTGRKKKKVITMQGAATERLRQSNCDGVSCTVD